MATEKEPTQRRVYVLPTELVDRIVEFQNEKGLPSEVEAARRLLDEALKTRDTEETLIKRFQSRLKQIRIPSEVAKDVLVGHPLVTNIAFVKDQVHFTMTGHGTYSISPNGDVLEKVTTAGGQNGWHKWLADDLPF